MEPLDELIRLIQPADKEFQEKAWERLRSQIRPRGSLGEIEAMAARLAGIYRTLSPDLSRKLIFTMAGDHASPSRESAPIPRKSRHKWFTASSRDGRPSMS